MKETFNYVVFAATEASEKFNLKAYQLLLDMKSMCETKRPGVSFKQFYALLVN